MLSRHFPPPLSPPLFPPIPHSLYLESDMEFIRTAPYTLFRNKTPPTKPSPSKERANGSCASRPSSPPPPASSGSLYTLRPVADDFPPPPRVPSYKDDVVIIKTVAPSKGRPASFFSEEQMEYLTSLVPTYVVLPTQRKNTMRRTFLATTVTQFVIRFAEDLTASYNIQELTEVSYCYVKFLPFSNVFDAANQTILLESNEQDRS